MTLHRFVKFIAHRIKQPLPGPQAQLKMAPEPVDGGTGRKFKAPADAVKSSVLILFYPNQDHELELILTLRNKDIDHGGQISFPGGRTEGNESETETALREVEEEIDIPASKITVIGNLSNLYIEHSNNYVTPVVGYMENQPHIKVNPDEVEEAFSIELDSLLMKKNLTVENWDLHSYIYRVPFWDVHRVPLWGATAMMLNEFLELYREFKTTNPGYE